MTIIHISGSQVESRLYSMLRNKINIHNKVIDLYKEIVDKDLTV